MRDRKFWIKTAVAVSAVTVAGLCARSEYEKDNFVIESIALYSRKVRHRHRFVFLTDLHDKEFGPHNRRLKEALRSTEPDAVLIGGDTMTARHGKADLRVTAELLSAASEICPVYYADGNHEQRLREERDDYPGAYEEFCQLLGKYGVTYLADSSALIDDEVRISGLDLDDRYYGKFSVPELPVSEITADIGEADTEHYQILMAHSPLFFDAYAGWGADLTLAGHFHGGTIRIPGLGGLMTPQFQFFSPYCAGTFRKGDAVMIAGRGLGTHTVNVRIGDRPQICIIEITPGKRQS